VVPLIRPNRACRRPRLPGALPTRLRSAAVFAALLAVTACGWSSRAPIERDYESARQAVRVGDYAQARATLDRILRPGAVSERSAGFRRLELLAAEVAILQRDFAAAEKILAAPLPEDDAFAALEARQRFLQGKLLVARNQFQAARDALAAARSVAASGTEVRLDIDHLDGQALLRLGKWADAETLLNDVVSRAAAASDDYHQALALNDLGMSRMVRSRFDEALPYFERVTTFVDLAGSSIYAASLNNAGSCYQRLGQFDRALALQQRAFEVHQRRGKREYFVQALGELGNLHVLRGAPADAVPFLRRAYQEAVAANLMSDAATWASNLAEAETRLGHWNEAERYNAESTRLKRSLGTGRVVYNTLVAGGIAEGRGRLDEAQRRYEEVLRDPAANQSLLWGAHAGLAGVARKRGQPALAAREFEAALDIIERTRSDLLKTDYKLSYLTQLISFYRDYVAMLIEEGRIERALEVADSSRGQVLAERQHVAAPPRVRAADLRRLAAATHAAFVSYWLTPSASFAWVVRPEGVTLTPLPPSPEIEKLAREHQAALGNALADPLAAADSAGARLYRLVVAPALRAEHRDERVIVVPDGALHAVNFETLPVDGARRHYWIEDAEVQVAPSLASLTPGDGQSSGPALVIGDPIARPPEFPALKFAPEEMAGIRRHLGAGRVTTVERERATPAAYREAQPGRFAFVHFAAHATANAESPLDSAVILSGPDGGYKLYARDVASQSLAAELVTVSACRSAGERAYAGEGLVGFAWAFLRAGARRVVAGLWDVEDRATARLMDGLYARIAAGDPPARALRVAKLDLIKEGGVVGSPYAWGAFELFTVTP
jgi:CHAT domain-containing protein/Tfp pilus assembly protein PilF